MVTASKDHAPEEREHPLRFSAVWHTSEVAAADARAAIRALLAQVGLSPHHTSSQDAQLVVSELVTNAARHAPGPGALEVELTADATLLRISVRDSSPRLPELRERNARRVGGHGLYLISRLCDQLHTVVLDAGKKIVAHLQLHTTPSGVEAGPRLA